MGYSYCARTGRLACDGCGHVGKVRKRTCPFKVTYPEGYSLPYCYPSALCVACYATHKATLHAGCAERAAARTAAENARGERLAAGASEIKAGYGSWHPSVPAGFVGVIFGTLGHAETYWLIPETEYSPGTKRYLSDYDPTTARLWTKPANITPAVVTVNPATGRLEAA